MNVHVGSVEVMPLLDAVGELGELSELYPDVAADEWAPYRELYPDLFTGARWRLPCASLLLRSGGTTVLVDTGVGPPGLWDWPSEWEGGLPDALGELGIGRDDVDVVFLTHLHIDHVGWNTDRGGRLFFPRARYVVHRDALAFVRSNDGRPHVERCISPLLDQFEPLAGPAEIATGVTAMPLEGHYPGHMGLRIASGGEDALLIGDAAVHPALLDHPEWRYVSDLDYERCVETRRRLIDELSDRDTLVACGHYPGEGIGRIVRRNGMTLWEAT